MASIRIRTDPAPMVLASRAQDLAVGGRKLNVAARGVDPRAERTSRLSLRARTVAAAAVDLLAEVVPAALPRERVDPPLDEAVCVRGAGLPPLALCGPGAPALVKVEGHAAETSGAGAAIPWGDAGMLGQLMGTGVSARLRIGVAIQSRASRPETPAVTNTRGIVAITVRLRATAQHIAGHRSYSRILQMQGLAILRSR
jgi:hypothetical protein